MKDILKNKIRNMVNESISKYLKENTEDLNQYVPRKAFNAVAKINQQLAELRQMMGTENAELLDTSSGVEDFYEVIGNVEIVNGVLQWEQKNAYEKNSYMESWNLIREDEEEGYWFDEYDFKDQMSCLKSGIRKAIKYFKEYNSEWDDDENKRDNFLGSLD